MSQSSSGIFLTLSLLISYSYCRFMNRFSVPVAPLTIPVLSIDLSVLTLTVHVWSLNFPVLSLRCPWLSLLCHCTYPGGSGAEGLETCSPGVGGQGAGSLGAKGLGAGGLGAEGQELGVQ